MRSILVICIIISSLAIKAQTKFGIHGGINTTQVDSKNISFVDENGNTDYTMGIENVKFGFHFGVFVLAKSDFLFIKPQVQFNSQTAEYRLIDLESSDTVNKILTETYQRIDVPLQLGLLLGPVRLGLGSVAHFNINTTSEVEDYNNSTTFSLDINNISFGYILGLGFDIWNFHLDFGYEGNFSKFGSHFVYQGVSYEFDKSPVRLIGSIGFTF